MGTLLSSFQCMKPIDLPSVPCKCASAVVTFIIVSCTSCWLRHGVPSPALVAQSVARWPVELRVAGSIPGQGHQVNIAYMCHLQRDVKSWVACVEVSTHRWAKTSANLPCGFAHSHDCFVTSNPNQSAMVFARIAS